MGILSLVFLFPRQSCKQLYAFLFVLSVRMSSLGLFTCFASLAALVLLRSIPKMLEAWSPNLCLQKYYALIRNTCFGIYVSEK